MRNVVIFSDNGTYSSYDESYNINPKCKKFIKTIFKEKGQIICVPFLQTFKEFYNRLDDEYMCNKLNSVDDSYKTWIIFNQIIDNPKEWHKNRFLSKLFKQDIYAENICMFVTEDELNHGKQDVPPEVYNGFKEIIFKICELLIVKEDSGYFDEFKIFLNDEEIITMDDDISIDFQDEYIGKRNELKFSEVIELDSNDVLIRKNGIIMHVYDNISELYFCPIYKSVDDLNLFKENIC